MRLFLVLLFASSAASACSCIQGDLEQELAAANVVFRGVVKSVNQLPSRVDLQRPRNAVTFTVSEYWKGEGELGRRITIDVIEPGADCVGARFDWHTDYVVFAKIQKADDYRMGNSFWYGWLDLMAKGTEFLTVNNFCNSTAPVKRAGNTLRALGQGKKPGG
jgi:hypothetical protein